MNAHFFSIPPSSSLFAAISVSVPEKRETIFCQYILRTVIFFLLRSPTDSLSTAFLSTLKGFVFFVDHTHSESNSSRVSPLSVFTGENEIEEREWQKREAEFSSEIVAHVTVVIVCLYGVPLSSLSPICLSFLLLMFQSNWHLIACLCVPATEFDSSLSSPSHFFTLRGL